MSDLPEPYVLRNPSDPIMAKEWNDIQIKGRQELRTHNHTGGAGGVRLSGDAIDPAASLQVTDMNVSGSLTVKALKVSDEIDSIRHRLAQIERSDDHQGKRFDEIGKDADRLGKQVNDVNSRLDQVKAALARYLNDANIAMGDRPLLLRGADDANHSLRYVHKLGSLTVDGPVLRGCSSGGLTVGNGSDEQVILTWDTSAIATTRRLRIKNAANSAQNLTVGAKGPHYDGDAIYGEANLHLDAAQTVYIKKNCNINAWDVAERFPAQGSLAVGEVVVYHAGTGAVAACTREADPCVVGIVSGDAAMILGTDQAEPAIALCGRVPCKVDADYAPIRPGDLLTTSATPGHACKAADATRATGAIMGKALAGLDGGRGEILVLVVLQ